MGDHGPPTPVTPYRPRSPRTVRKRGVRRASSHYAKRIGGLRPIAVGDTLRRLVAKWLLASAQGRNAAAAIAQLQTAFAKGTPCEVVAMGVRPTWMPCTRARGDSCCKWA